MALTQFTRNYSDRSTDKGYQFEFYCDTCAAVVRSNFQASKLGMAAGLLRAASSLFGGALGGAAQSADYVKDALRGDGWDSAFNEAVEDAKPKFRHCAQCGKWVCPGTCWDASRSLCQACAGLAADAAPPSAATAPCPHCQAVVDAASKFCPECGKPMHVAEACSKCGTKLAAGAKFCPECGTPRA